MSTDVKFFNLFYGHFYASTIVTRFLFETFAMKWAGFTCRFIGGSFSFLVYGKIRNRLLSGHHYDCYHYKKILSCYSNHTDFSNCVASLTFAEKAIFYIIFWPIRSQPLASYLQFTFIAFLSLPHSYPHPQVRNRFFLIRFNHLIAFTCLEALFPSASFPMSPLHPN